MGRFRGAGPRPHRHRQGRDRPGHPHRAHADRGGRARRHPRSDPHRVGRDRRQPVRVFHLGQLFGLGRRRGDPAGLRGGALAVPGSRRRSAQMPGRRAFDRGRKIPPRRQGGRQGLLVDVGADLARPPGQRDRADQAAFDLSHRRKEPAAARSSRESRGRALHPRHHAGRRRARARAAAAVASRAACCARRGRRAQGGKNADRDSPRGRLRRFHRGQRTGGDARSRSPPARWRAGTAARRRPTTSASRTGSRRSPRATARSRPALPDARRKAASCRRAIRVHS